MRTRVSLSKKGAVSRIVKVLLVCFILFILFLVGFVLWVLQDGHGYVWYASYPEPSPRNPIAMVDNIRITELGQIDLTFSFYNRHNETLHDLLMKFEQCLNSEGQEMRTPGEFGERLPQFEGVTHTVEPGTTVKYEGVLTLPGGYVAGRTYICSVVMTSQDSNGDETVSDLIYIRPPSSEPSLVLEQKQIFLEVISQD